MTADQIKLVKTTWRMIRHVDPALVGDLFYSKLFADTPSLRHLFPRQMGEQYRKLVDMLNMVVARLERLDELSAEVGDLARRHVDYGVRPAHYKLVGNALLWTLQQGLGKDWTPEVKEAWVKCYTILSDTMIKASALQPKK